MSGPESPSVLAGKPDVLAGKHRQSLAQAALGRFEGDSDVSDILAAGDHQTCNLYVPARRHQRFERRLGLYTRHGLDNPHRPVSQFVVRRPDVDHEVAVCLPELDHGRCRDRVESDLLSRSGVQPARTGDHLSADDQLDGVVSGLAKRAARVARQPDGGRTNRTRVIDCTQDIWRAPAGRDANNGIGLAHDQGGHCLGAGTTVVFGPLGRVAQCVIAAGDDGFGHAGGHAKGRAEFGGIEDRQPAGCTCTHIDEPASSPEPSAYHLDGRTYGGGGGHDGIGGAPRIGRHQ